MVGRDGRWLDVGMSSLVTAPDAAPRHLRPARPRRHLARIPLARPRTTAVTGVAAGLSDHLGVSATRVRIILVAASLIAGAGALFYLWCWAFMPLRSGDARPTRRVPVAWILSAAAAVSLAGLASATASVSYVWVDGSLPSMTGYAWAFPTTVPWVVATTLLATGAGVWAAGIDRGDPARGPRHALVIRVFTGAVLIAVFALVMGTTGVLGTRAIVIQLLVPAAGLAVVVASTVLQAWRRVVDDRVGRMRDEQRAAMAAHLHDSVLQTLALIQNRAGASTEVSRIARAQERELRAWLYDGDSPADSDLPTDLRDYAGALELDFPVRIDVVSTGSSAERASGELAAAAREAMLNAARHAGGDVSVYIEGAASAVEVFIRDRGDGFDPADVPADRWGVRESIVGRMRRAGGTAVIRSGAGVRGTEVRLSVPTTAAARRG